MCLKGEIQASNWMSFILSVECIHYTSEKLTLNLIHLARTDAACLRARTLRVEVSERLFC